MDVLLGNVKDNLRGFVLKAARLRALEDDEELFGSGLVTSLFAMQLIEYIEKDYPIVVDGDDMNLRTFKSVNTVSEFVVRKLAESAGSRNGK
ncbi:hypothetical protein [Bradyrhizobium prioriisuperbiae]|uniref:hypothetical protein n=1 Tax=Bradyrhizobium prioriisuperbiae TaxID=2854389 RepID=UPI0028F04196|nr:hypothetical protein [Bradyrhizobium prioritasuperba]